jgi:hypothetical protein
MARFGNPLCLTLLALLLVGCGTATAATTYYIAPSGSDAGSCSQDRPCGTLDRAFHAAAPGDVVQLADGSYGDQRVRPDASKTAPVTLQAAPGATPSFGALDIGASNVTVIGPYRATSLSTNGQPGSPIRNVLVQNVTVDGQARQTTVGYAASIQNVTWRDIDISNDVNSSLVLVDGGPAGGVADMTIDHVTFHDALTTPGSTAHTECLYLLGGTRITVRNSFFYNCRTFDMFVTGSDASQPSDYTVESNVFEHSIFPDGKPHYISVQFRDQSPVNGLQFRNNTAETPVGWPSDPVGPRGGTVAGNLLAGGAECKSGLTFSHNVTTGSACSSTDVRASGATLRGGFVDYTHHNWRLKQGALAIDRGDPSNFPATDRDGLRRLGAPDAGAHEYGGLGTPAPEPGGSPGGGTAGGGTTGAGAPGSAPNIVPAVNPPGAGGTSDAATTPTGRVTVSRLRLSHRTLCRRTTGSCRSRTARLGFDLSRAAAVTIRLQRVTRAHRLRTIRVARLTAAKAGRQRVTLRARGLPSGRYRVTIVAQAGAGKPFTREVMLRVR